MASILKVVKFSKHLSVKPSPLFINSVRTLVNTKDWQPGPIPKTEEERIKAARKYNLHPDEYVVYPEDHPMGLCKGDYPVLPVIGHAAKDPYYPYDIPVDRRNYNETLPEEFEYLGPERLDYIGVRPTESTATILLSFFGAMGTLVLLFFIGDKYKYFRPVLQKQYPAYGGKHYTFEPLK